ncbi:Protein FAM151B, partial [Camelus dromedarius]
PEKGSAMLLTQISLPPLTLFPAPAWLWKAVMEGKEGGGWEDPTGSWSENILEYFLRNNQITAEDGAQIIWYHAANHKVQVNEALKSTAHMIEADVILPSDGSEHGQPIMAHPPETNSDNTLQEWLAEVIKSNKGIKLDFKRYSLTVWTGKDDNYSTEDLLFIRDHFDKKQVFYDILEPQNHEFKQAIGIKINL